MCDDIYKQLKENNVKFEPRLVAFDAYTRICYL